MVMVPYSHFIIVAFILFAIGLVGLFTRRNTLLVLLSIELLFNSVNLLFVTFSGMVGNLDGQIAALFSMAIAAAELFRSKKTVDVSHFNSLKE
ncbi:MAG: NADH-quinone oxidoreductase subunit NuoK [Candidatus Omnitrophica bacterium]|nr:NADH-quinone oxidoreductase subunit NuoK [Candidatus Omnitrophota bacterium]